jgi:hypothetical protein
MTSDSTLRVGDVEREQVATVLGEHLSAGRLAISEFESRLDTLYAARTRGELDAVLADLPTTPLFGPGPQPPRLGPRAGPWWTPWALTGVICLLVWLTVSLIQGHPLYFWPVWVIGPWGAVLLVRAATGGPRSRRSERRREDPVWLPPGCGWPMRFGCSSGPPTDTPDSKGSRHGEAHLDSVRLRRRGGRGRR